MMWLRVLALAAIMGALLTGAERLKGHYVAQGDATGRAAVQQAWDQQRAADLAELSALQAQSSAEAFTRFKNAERIANEQARKNSATTQRMANLGRTVDGLRATLAALQQQADAKVPGADAAARAADLAGQAATLRELFGSCAERYGAVAASADALRDQVAGLLAYMHQVCQVAPQTPP